MLENASNCTSPVMEAGIVFPATATQNVSPMVFLGVSSTSIMILLAVASLCIFLHRVFKNWDIADFGFAIVSAFQMQRMVFLKEFDAKAMSKMFQSSDKGNFLESNHAQDAWKPILSVESAAGEDWQKLRAALLKVLKHIQWQDRLQPILAKVLEGAEAVLDCKQLKVIVMKVLFELVTGRELPQDAIGSILKGVDAWTVSLAGKGVGEYADKAWVLKFMQEAVDAMPDKPFDKDDIYTMSAIMQPLFVSPLINVPDVFAVAEKHLPGLSSEELFQLTSNPVVSEAFLKECLRIGHPFPIIERKVPGMVGSYQITCRYDVMCQSGPGFDMSRWLQCPVSGASSHQGGYSPPKMGTCPYENMLFGAGPRRCQGKELALTLMRGILMHYADSSDKFQPSVGHGISGRTNDENGSAAEDLHKGMVILKTIYKTSVICAPLRMLTGTSWVGH